MRVIFFYLGGKITKSFPIKQKRAGKPALLVLFCVQSLSVMLVSYGQLLAALSAARSQYSATVGGSHSLTETVLVVATAIVGLECSLHLILYRFYYFRPAKLQTFFDTCKFFTTFAPEKSYNPCKLPQ